LLSRAIPPNGEQNHQPIGRSEPTEPASHASSPKGTSPKHPCHFFASSPGVPHARGIHIQQVRGRSGEGTPFALGFRSAGRVPQGPGCQCRLLRIPESRACREVQLEEIGWKREAFGTEKGKEACNCTRWHCWFHWTVPSLLPGSAIQADEQGRLVQSMPFRAMLL
jgi:hypothetical protein